MFKRGLGLTRQPGSRLNDYLKGSVVRTDYKVIDGDFHVAFYLSAVSNEHVDATFRTSEGSKDKEFCAITRPRLIPVSKAAHFTSPSTITSTKWRGRHFAR